MIDLSFEQYTVSQRDEINSEGSFSQDFTSLHDRTKIKVLNWNLSIEIRMPLHN